MLDEDENLSASIARASEKLNFTPVNLWTIYGNDTQAVCEPVEKFSRRHSDVSRESERRFSRDFSSFMNEFMSSLEPFFSL